MANELDQPPEVPDDCEGPDLSNLAKARKALASACRLIKAGKIPSDRAGSYVNALTALVKAHQDARDSLWTKRAAVMWNERQKTNAEPAPHH